MSWTRLPIRTREVTARPQLDLELRGIRKRYGDFTAVDGVSLQVEKGQFVCLLGPLRLRQDHDLALRRRAWKSPTTAAS